MWEFFFIFLKNFAQIGCRGVLSQFNGSPYLLISSVYPEYEWLPWKFNQIPKGFWNDMKNQRNFMDWAGKQLNYIIREDWYKTTAEVLSLKLKIKNLRIL